MKLQSVQSYNPNIQKMMKSSTTGCSRFGDGTCPCCPPEATQQVAETSLVDPVDSLGLMGAMPLEPLSALAIAAGSIMSSFLSMLLFFGGGGQKPKP